MHFPRDFPSAPALLPELPQNFTTTACQTQRSVTKSTPLRSAYFTNPESATHTHSKQYPRHTPPMNALLSLMSALLLLTAAISAVALAPNTTSVSGDTLPRSTIAKTFEEETFPYSLQYCGRFKDQEIGDGQLCHCWNDGYASMRAPMVSAIDLACNEINNTVRLGTGGLPS